MTVSAGNFTPSRNGENKFCRTGSTRPTATETRVSNWSVYGTSHGSFGINQIQTIQTATFGRFSSEFIFPVFWRV
jgi:hypothetical protein